MHCLCQDIFNGIVNARIFSYVLEGKKSPSKIKGAMSQLVIGGVPILRPQYVAAGRMGTIEGLRAYPSYCIYPCISRPFMT